MAYERALALRPDHAEALLELGGLYAEADDAERAVPLLAAAVEQRPGDERFLQGVTTAAERLGDWAFALAVYERSAQSMPQEAAIHDGQGQLLQRLGRFASAIECYARALAIDPQRRTTRLNQGHAYESLGELEQARVCYEHVLASFPSDGAAIAGNASCALRACDWNRVGRMMLQLHETNGLDQLNPFIRFALDLPPEELACRCPTSGGHDCRRGARQTDRAARSGPAARCLPLARLSTAPGGLCTCGVIAHHDRRRVECLGVSLVAPDDSAIARQLVASFDGFIDAGATGERRLIEQLREREIDVAIDLAGFTAGARPSVFASRVAPIQVNYLGFPGIHGCAVHGLHDR